MKNLFLALALTMSLWSFNQNSTKATIAVANPNVEGLSLTPTLASKLIQLELIKLDKFAVYDEFDMAEVLKTDSQFTQDCYGVSCLSNMGKKLNVEEVKEKILKHFALIFEAEFVRERIQI